VRRAARRELLAVRAGVIRADSRTAIGTCPIHDGVWWLLDARRGREPTAEEAERAARVMASGEQAWPVKVAVAGDLSCCPRCAAASSDYGW